MATYTNRPLEVLGVRSTQAVLYWPVTLESDNTTYGVIPQTIEVNS